MESITRAREAPTAARLSTFNLPDMAVTSVDRNRADNGSMPGHARIGILGAGFGGLGMAIKLKQAGIDDFVIWERDDDVGGTWWANTYPGCQCDIPSHLYSFSFAPNPEWTRTYPLQPEIEAVPAPRHRPVRRRGTTSASAAR